MLGTKMSATRGIPEVLSRGGRGGYSLSIGGFKFLICAYVCSREYEQQAKAWLICLIDA